MTSSTFNNTFCSSSTGFGNQGQLKKLSDYNIIQEYIESDEEKYHSVIKVEWSSTGIMMYRFISKTAKIKDLYFESDNAALGYS